MNKGETMSTDQGWWMLAGERPEGCTCERIREMRESIGNPPEPAEWSQNPDCPLHGDGLGRDNVAGVTQ